MADPKPAPDNRAENSDLKTDSNIDPEHCTRVQPEYVAVFNTKRKFVEVSPSFSKLLGYSQEELIGRRYDEFTARRTNHIAMTWKLLVSSGCQFGIWVLVHRTGTKLFVRYETFERGDGLFQANMELLAAGA
jgi:PAS domain S-box-containing protein